ncbi:MAG: hypothetical protein ACI97K_000735 [Glaciecola sp.]|jgi:hypothetical protein
MKILFTSIAIATIAFTSSVSATNVQIRPADDTFETKVCYAAATQGLKAAYNLVKESDENLDRFTSLLTCNGKSLARTAKTFKKAQTPAVRKVRFVTDDAAASKICLDAVIFGVNIALEKHGVKNENIICNNLNINSFAKRFAGKSVAL